MTAGRTHRVAIVTVKILGGVADPEAQGYPIDEIEACNDQRDIENILVRQTLDLQWTEITLSHCRGRASPKDQQSLVRVFGRPR